MLKALAAFESAIADARSSTALYDFLTTSVRSPLSYDDLLRSQIVYAVSAFDKLMHDIIRVGVLAIYTGKRSPTPKYNCEPIPIELHGSLMTATIPPKEILFEQQISIKLRTLSFQDPAKVADGLSYIWNEKDKWTKIGLSMGTSGEDAKTRLKLIVSRRNAIVHESDMDPISATKTAITRGECAGMTDFIELCGKSITHLVL